MASVAVDMGCAALELSTSMVDLPIPARSEVDETESLYGATSKYQDTPVPGFGDLVDFSRYETGGDVDPFSVNVHPAFVGMEKQEPLFLENMLNVAAAMPAFCVAAECWSVGAAQGQARPMPLPARAAPEPMQTPMQTPQGMPAPSPFQTPMQQPMQQPMQNISPIPSAQVTPVRSASSMAAGYDIMPSIYNQMNATPQMTGAQINGAQMMHGNQMNQMNGYNVAPPQLPPQAARDYQILQDLLTSGRVTVEMLANVANAQGVGLPNQRARKMNRSGKKNKSNEPREKVFIGGLDGDVTDDMLLEYFNGFNGTVLDAAVLRDGPTGLSRGFGYVTFANIVPEGVYGHVHTINGRRCGVRPYNYTPSF